MRCPSCGCLESKVVDSRPSEDAASIRRRRECLSCQHRFTTYERMEDIPVMVIKSDGSSEVFDREKLLRGIMSACAKRPISPSQIDDLITGIINDIESNQRREIGSKELGDLTLSHLARLDDVAYIRFMSVYKDFQNIEEFAAALKDLS